MISRHGACNLQDLRALGSASQCAFIVTNPITLIAYEAGAWDCGRANGNSEISERSW